MCIDQVAEQFRVCATSPDGVIEAYETEDDEWWCVGVQWHPENESASALDMQVFEQFVDACRKTPAVLEMNRALNVCESQASGGC